MVRVSVLNDALKTLYNAEKRGKRQVLLRPSSKVVIKFLQVMMRHGEQARLTQFRVARKSQEHISPRGVFLQATSESLSLWMITELARLW